MKSRNFRELIRVADLLNSNIAIAKDKVDVNIIRTTTDGYITLEIKNPTIGFEEKLIKELSQSGFESIESESIDIDITILKILLVRD